MIEIKNLCKSFENNAVIDNLNCTIKDGSIYGLVGANGAGKSTFLRLINSIYLRDSGSILIDGQEVDENEELKQKIAFLADSNYIFPDYTLLDLAKMYESMYEKFDMNYLKELAGELKLDLNKRVGTYSKGLKRQCSIICILATKCEYMFFDETFDGLDTVVKAAVKKVISKQMKEEKLTIIMTSHNLRELEDICDSIGVLYKGGILLDSEINSFKTNMVKVQVGFNEEYDESKFESVHPISYKKSGSISTLVIRNSKEEVEKVLRKMNPIILDFIPLSLEEIFIFEMEVNGYDFKEILE